MNIFIITKKFISTILTMVIVVTGTLTFNILSKDKGYAANEVIEIIGGLETDEEYPEKLNTFGPNTTQDAIGKSLPSRANIKTHNNEVYFTAGKGEGDILAKINLSSKKFEKVAGELWLGSSTSNENEAYQKPGFTADQTHHDGEITKYTIDPSGNIYYFGDEFNYYKSDITKSHTYIRKIDSASKIVSEIYYETKSVDDPYTIMNNIKMNFTDLDKQGTFYFCSGDVINGTYENGIYAYNTNSNTYSTILSGIIENDDPFADVIGIFDCLSLALSPNTNTLYLSQRNSISVIDLTTKTIRSEIPISGTKALTFDQSGNLYALIHKDGSFIKKIDPNTGATVTIAGGASDDPVKISGKAPLAANLSRVSQIHIDKKGTLFFTTKHALYQIKNIGDTSSPTNGNSSSTPSTNTESSNTTNNNEFGNFNDVPSTHPYFEAIQYVKEKGIVQGYSDGTYRPDQPINRAELTKIVIEAIHPGKASGEFCFSDVLNDWSAPYICYGKSKGIVGGYPSGDFIGWNNVSFAEAAKIILKALGIEIPDGDPWFKNYVLFLETAGAIPLSIATFTQEITRAEMAEIIYRLLEKVDYKVSREYWELGF